MVFTIICNQYLGSAETERILVTEPRVGEEGNNICKNLVMWQFQITASGCCANEQRCN